MRGAPIPMDTSCPRVPSVLAMQYPYFRPYTEVSYGTVELLSKAEDMPGIRSSRVPYETPPPLKLCDAVESIARG